MIQRGDGFGFALEPEFRLGIVQEVIWKDLDGYRSSQARVGRLVHVAHPAGPQHLPKRIMAEPPPGPHLRKLGSCCSPQRNGFYRRSLHETVGTTSFCDQGFYFAAKRLIAAAFSRQKCCALLRRKLQS